jgi:hypothetical protein
MASGLGNRDRRKHVAGCGHLAQAREKFRHAVLVSTCIHVGHCVLNEHHVVAQLMSVARCRFDTNAGRDSAEKDLRDTQVLQMPTLTRV